jgi:hypothetical protein
VHSMQDLYRCNVICHQSPPSDLEYYVPPIWCFCSPQCHFLPVLLSCNATHCQIILWLVSSAVSFSSSLLVGLVSICFVSWVGSPLYLLYYLLHLYMWFLNHLKMWLIHG